jgi:hypothetical protein
VNGCDEGNNFVPGVRMKNAIRITYETKRSALYFLSIFSTTRNTRELTKKNRKDTKRNITCSPCASAVEGSNRQENAAKK